MKPSTTHIDSESWLHDDTALRRAVQQQNAELPSLPEGFAERMREKLSAQTAAPKRPLWPWLTAAAASIAAALALFFLFDGTPTEQPYVPQPALITEQAPAPLAAQPTTATSPAESTAIPQSSRLTAAPESAKPAATARPSKSTTTAQTSSSNSQVVTPPAQEPSLIAEQPATVTTSPLDSVPDGLLAEVTETAIVSNNSDFAASLDPAPPASKSSAPLQFALNCSPTALSSTINSPQPTAPAPMTSSYYLPAGEGYTYANTSVRSTSTSLRQAPQQPDPVSSTDHKLPLTFALSVSVPLHKRLSLETGLAYTRLASTFEEGVTTNYLRTSQIIHYLGVPLHLHCDIIQQPRWRFYGLAGCSVDFPIASSSETIRYQAFGGGKPTEGDISPPVQFAPTVGLGIQLNLSRHAGLFIQPSVQWFVPTGSSVETYRSEHPVNFTLPFGFRWTL